jgi:SAM-dependent methyltransferase
MGPGVALAMALTERIPVATHHFDPDLLDALRSCGLVGDAAGEPGSVVSRLSVTFLGDAIVVADAGHAAADSVMAPGGGTAMLASLLPDDLAGKRILDLGAGPGSIGLVAALGGAHVVAADLSPRCAAFIECNALLNDVDANVEVRLGDLYEPVAGELFDVVVSHPPYLERPDDIDPVLYMHSGPQGDELALAVVSGAPAVLRPGGEALIHFHAPGDLDPAGERVRASVARPEADFCAFAVQVESPDFRAVTTGLLHDPDVGAVYDETVLRYRRHFDDRERSTAMLVYLRRRADDDPSLPWSAILGAARLPHARVSLDLHVRALDAIRLGDDELLALRVTPPPDARIVTRQLLAGVGNAVILELPSGCIATEANLEPDAAQLVLALAQTPSVGEAVRVFSATTGQDPAVAAGTVVSFVRENLVRGALVVADG